MIRPTRIALPACLRALWRQCCGSAPIFLLRETLRGYASHHGFNGAASLSFFTLFALIPMALLIFFLLSHLVVSSGSATAKLALLTSNLVPKFSHRIMIEVYHATQHRALWGVFGMFAMLWAVTPLAGALRLLFQAIFGSTETRSLWRRQSQDALAVLLILLLFFAFTLSGLLSEKVLQLLQPLPLLPGLATTLISLSAGTLLLAVFYRITFPVTVAFRHLLLGALLTAALWFAMRPAFGLFLFAYQSYSAIFGGLKNLFISIAWLYYSYVVLLLGTELIAVLHQQKMLLLKTLFTRHPPYPAPLLHALMRAFGRTYRQGAVLFAQGSASETLYFIVAGEITMTSQQEMLHRAGAGEMFGDLAMLSGEPHAAEARVSSASAQLLALDAGQVNTLLEREPAIAIALLRDVARRLRQTRGLNAPQH